MKCQRGDCDEDAYRQINIGDSVSPLWAKYCLTHVLEVIEEMDSTEIKRLEE